MNLGMPELLIVLVVVLVLFGGKRLPGLAKAIGDSVREFKKGMLPEDERRADHRNDERDERNRPEPRVERQAQIPRPQSSEFDHSDSANDEPTANEKDKSRKS